MSKQDISELESELDTTHELGTEEYDPEFDPGIEDSEGALVGHAGATATSFKAKVKSCLSKGFGKYLYKSGGYTGQSVTKWCGCVLSGKAMTTCNKGLVKKAKNPVQYTNKIALKAYNGKYLIADKYLILKGRIGEPDTYNWPLFSKYSAIGNLEKFTLQRVTNKNTLGHIKYGDVFKLKTGWGRYVQSLGTYSDYLYQDFQIIHVEEQNVAWEQFKFVPGVGNNKNVGDKIEYGDKVAIKNVHNNKLWKSSSYGDLSHNAIFGISSSPAKESTFTIVKTK